jgi:hypothetical protein
MKAELHNKRYISTTQSEFRKALHVNGECPVNVEPSGPYNQFEVEKPKPKRKRRMIQI